MALALWYWLYCHANRRAYAEEVTKAAGFDIKHFDRHFQTDPDDDLTKILKRSVEPQDGLGPLVDVQVLGQFLENFLSEQYTDPCLMILLNDMEKLLQPKTKMKF